MESTTRTDDVINKEMNNHSDEENIQNVSRYEEDKGGIVEGKQGQFDILNSIDETDYKYKDVHFSPRIECFVNGCVTLAVIDSGCERSTMSIDFAKKCGIAHLIDTRCCCEAIGTSSKEMTLGGIHFCPIKTATNEFLTSLAIIPTEEFEEELTLGMDILQRYKCTLDWSNNKLLIDTTHSDESFLEGIETKEGFEFLYQPSIFYISYMWIKPIFFGDPRLRNLEANMKAAETLGEENKMPSPYIDCKVNGHHVRALVDSGAEYSIMSVQCAERCGIRKLADPGMLRPLSNLGKCQKTEGTVQDCVVNIEKDELLVSLNINELSEEEMLLGVDLMMRYECSIDLKSNNFIIGTTQSRANLVFLSDGPGQNKQ